MLTSKPNLVRIYDEGCPHSSDIIYDENLHLRRFNVFVVILMLFIVAALVFMSISFFIASNRPSTALSFTMDDVGRVVEIEPTSQPYSPARVTAFTTKNVKDALHISFTDYADHFLSIAKRFTAKGFQSYQKELVDKGWMNKILTDNLTMWVEIRQAPKFTDSGLSGDTYYYQMTFDVDMFLGGGDKVYSPVRLNVSALVVRTKDNLDGLKIQRLLIGESN
jgi:hypothetical protein